MRPVLPSLVLFVTVLVPNMGKAQVYQLPTPPPQVTAAGASWQINGAPVFFAGDFYYPTGPTVFFNGFVMVRSGMYQGVPVYADTTLEPYSVVYVPIGGNVMRPYERKRRGELAGTVGSRVPSFPIRRDVEVSASTGAVGLETPPSGPPETAVVPEAPAAPRGERPTGTVGSIVPSPVTLAASNRPRPTAVESIPPPRSNAGIWIEFRGARWYSAGGAVPFSAERFAPIGEYHGFLVYRDQNGGPNEIYIPTVPDGPLAPYSKR